MGNYTQSIVNFRSPVSTQDSIEQTNTTFASPQALPQQSHHSLPTSSTVRSSASKTHIPTVTNVHTSINQTAPMSERFVIAFPNIVIICYFLIMDIISDF